MDLSNKIIGILNLAAFLCSIPIIGSGIWLGSGSGSECMRSLGWAVIILGAVVLLVSLAGFIGACWNQQHLLVAHLFFMASLIVLLLAVLVFAFVVTSPNRGYSQHRLQGFSAWLRHYVADDARWVRIRNCLANSDLCARLARDDAYFTADQFSRAHLSLIQSGCCKPPSACGYGYVNPTVWVSAVNMGADTDCYAWSNDQTQLCYSCDACKAGMIENLRSEWRKAIVVLIASAVALIFVYVIGCSALRNAQTEELFRRYKQGFA